MPSASLQKEQQRLETEVRASALRARGNGQWTRAPFSPADLLDELGPAQLIEIVDVDGGLHVLICGSGRIRQFAAGQAERRPEGRGFRPLRPAPPSPQPARRRPGQRAGRAGSGGTGTPAALLGPAVRHLGDGPVIIVPTGKLHPIPWAILPALKDRVISVAPSAGAWMRRPPAPEPRHRHVVLARGPGLVTDGAEVPAGRAAVRRRHGAGRRRGHGRQGAVRAGRGLAGAHRRARDLPGRQPAVLLAADARRAADRLRLRAAEPRAVPAGPVQLRRRRAGARRR